MTINATVIRYEQSPFYPDWVQMIYRVDSGEVRHGGQFPVDERLLSPGTRIQF